MSNEILMKYATIESNSRGRQFVENYDDAKFRSIYGRDRDRIIGSSAFRRLQYKTQVFVNHYGDHYRTRLTHSLEVAQTARWIAGGINVNKDLAEIVSLAHDLGHPPFGHAGEEALNQEIINYSIKNSKEKFGFSHNVHTLKIITEIESRFIEFKGLNLSWETIEGLVKHNGAFKKDNKDIDPYIINFDQKFNLDLFRQPSLEAQISAIADDITYNNHDLEDGLRASLLDLNQIIEIPLVGKIYKDLLDSHPSISREMLTGEARKRIMLAMVVDVINNSKINLKNFNIENSDDVRNLNCEVVNFSKEMLEINYSIKKFLMKNMYLHPDVKEMTGYAKRVISRIFNYYISNPQSLPIQYQKIIDSKTIIHNISDYIAGMTDRFAISLYEEIGL